MEAVMIFCRDVDLLYWEPDVLREAAFGSQTLMAGTGNLAGPGFTPTTGGAFTNQHVVAGNVITFSGAAVGTYAITLVDGPFTLYLSAIYDELFPTTGTPPTPVASQTANGVAYVIRTFWAQRRVVSDLLMQAVGIVPGTAEAATAAVLNPEALRRPCVLGTLQMIYSAVAAAASEPARYAVRAELYERLYRRALLAAQVDLDLDGDGRVDVRRSPGLVRMVRE
jgi:hypothetical protein